MNQLICQCTDDGSGPGNSVSVRPCEGAADWGGFNTTCSAPAQTLTVVCTSGLDSHAAMFLFHSSFIVVCILLREESCTVETESTKFAQIVQMVDRRPILKMLCAQSMFAQIV